jgi:putative transposase
MIKTYYKGNLPHIQPIGATFFVTFHLNGAIPQPLIADYKSEYEEALTRIEYEKSPNMQEQIYNLQKLFFKKYDDLLHAQKDGPHHFNNPTIRQILADQIMRFDQQWYDTLAFCIMSNHCHWVADFSKQLAHIDPLMPITEHNYTQLFTVMQRIKGATARYANQILQTDGQFFYHESYDHFVRHQKELSNIINYTLQNPVKAKLVERWADWAGNYCCPSLIESQT